MILTPNKNEIRKARHKRMRNTLKGCADKPRLNVYRSSCNIYAQIIDDVAGKTLVSSSTIAKGTDIKDLNKTEAAKQVGIKLAEAAKNAGIETVVFDRGGYLYTGRVRALAEGAREGGLKF